ncbi:MAG: PilN domain-containing protein [Planctomycetes bacterium]|nr:PilN domain-containing protein [Planctomycetota bacterium]
MIGVNVLPESYVHVHRRRARVHGWFAVSLAVGCLAAGPVGLDAWRTAQASSLQSEVDPLRARLSKTERRLAESGGLVTGLQQQLARADALRSKRPWKDLLAALAKKVPDEVWLMSLESVDEQPGRVLTGGTTGDDASVELAGPSGLRIVGFALGHEHLYAFMGALNDGALFSHVELVKAGQQKVLQGNAVRFVLECQW